MLLTVAAVGKVIAAVDVMFNVSLPPAPSRTSPTVQVVPTAPPSAVSEAVKVSLLAVPVNEAPESEPLVSVIERQP
jgi:hypothetical protein